jgi:hypothetical protein
VATSAPGERQHQRDGRPHHQRGTDEVELVRTLVPRRGAAERCSEEISQRAKRQVEPENPRPVQVLGDEAADDRPPTVDTMKVDDV